MIQALLCALFGHRPSLTTYVVVSETGNSGTLRPCTRCPVFVRIEKIGT